MKKKIIERFLRYVSVDTQSNDASDSYPSTSKQFDLANLLVSELKSMGVADAHVDEHCYVMATLPSNSKKSIPIIGFIAHLDTSPDMPGNNVKVQIIDQYNCEDIILNKDHNIKIKVKDYPELLRYKDNTILCTDGTTLLGADDKAGIAEIMTAVEYLMQHPEIEHGTIKIGFTPDEEIGRGVDKFDVTKFGAEYAYTMDGGGLGELEFENFNAAGVKITIHGNNIHPGYAKNKMLNAAILTAELNSMLPVNERPEFTDGYEGFFHLMRIEATVEQASMHYIIRDHDKQLFENRKKQMREVVSYMNQKYGLAVVELEMKDQYYNMREKVEPVYHIVEKAITAMEMAGIKPDVKPIRGGTDGARLSYMGLPCPNIFGGGHNFHGKYEYVSADTMVKATEVILNIIKISIP